MAKGNTSTTPGMDVLLITTAYTGLCIIIGFLFKCRKRKWRNDMENTSAANPGNEEKDDQNMPDDWMDTVIEHSLFDRDKIYHTSDTNSVESDDSSKAYEYWEHAFGGPADGNSNAAGDSNSYKLFAKDSETAKIPQSIKVNDDSMGGLVSALKLRNKQSKQLKGRKKKVEMKRFLFGKGKGTFSVKKIKKEAVKNKSVHEVVDRSGKRDDTYEEEMKEIYKLAVPWTISSFVSYLSSIVAFALISSYMSVAAMICYSYVWFIIDAAFIYSSALYNSLYKHVNNAVATETDEGYNKAGTYIRVCMLINLIVSVPISIAVVYGMGPIMRFYGFDDATVLMCHDYTIIAVIHNFASTTSGFVAITTDIDGYADFNAKYAFFDSLSDIAISAFVIPLCRPSLLQLGLIHFAHEIISTAFYYFLTHSKWGWYDLYMTGLMNALTYDRKEKKAISTLIKKSIPMTLDELNGKLEWLVSAYFASFLGATESASWILLSYLWGLIGVVPSCIGSAAEYRVAYQLSKGNIEVAKQMSNRTMVLTGITSLVSTAILFAARNPLISVITNDADLFAMLIGVMPYLLLCQPLISLTTTGAYLNRALAMYQRSTKIELLITCLVTLPAAWVSTFIFGWDISGLIAASFVGYATMGAVILAIYNNADWEKAVRKNRKMAGTVESSKLGCEEDTKKPELSLI